MNIKQIILTFNNHASIEKFREFLSEISSNDFEFTEVTEDDVKKVLKLNTKKPSTNGSIVLKKTLWPPFTAHCSSTRPLLLIPALTLKQSVETYLHVFKNTINLAISECELFDQLQNWK